MAAIAASLFIAPLVLVGVVSGVLLLRARRVRAATDVTRWERTMGTVLSATVQVGTGSRSELPLVFYAYQVNGKVFQGQRVRMNGACDASTAIARYPAGTPVVVYYEASNPENSALEL